MNKLIVIAGYTVLMLSTGLYANHIYIDDGLNHIISDDVYINDTVWLDYIINNDPGTHIDLIDGGIINNFLYTYKESTVSVNGGHIGGLWLYDESSAIIDCGDIGVGLATYDDSNVYFDGGTISGEVYATDTSNIKMNGGFSVWLLATKQGRINLNGGTIESILLTRENGTIYISGNNFEVTAGNITTPLIYGDRLSDYGILGNDGLNDYLAGTITVILEDGTPINNEFNIYDTSDIIIVPEPASALILATGCVVVLRRKKSNL